MKTEMGQRVIGEEKYVLFIEEGITYPTKRSPECPQQSRRDRQGLIPWPDHPARPLQVGPAHHRWRDCPEERPQPICPQRLCRWCADRHAAEPAVWRSEIYPEVEPAGPAEAATFDQDSTRRQPEQRHRAMACSGG